MVRKETGLNAVRYLLTFALLAAVCSTGCDELSQQQPNQQNKTAKPKLNHGSTHRFVLTKYPLDSGTAFDTQTGQLCRTWDWQPVSGPGAVNMKTGLAPETKPGEFAPTCLSLYEKYPSGDSATIVSDDSN
jgi:hypothetical protein